MKNTVVKAFYILAVILVLCNLIFCMRDSFIIRIDDLPAGVKTAQSVSPNGTRVLNVYTVDNSFGTAVRVALQKNGNAKEQNIYWQVKTDRSQIEWMDENNVSINGVVVNIGMNGIYDCRRGLSILREGSMEGSFNEKIVLPEIRK
ncbi:MAG: hypothetical protein IKI29_07375 [Clostridia bacterium]|nr:hypothetical protein [Clostridia bacterium]